MLLRAAFVDDKFDPKACFGCIERMGQAEHDVYFGSDDSEYR